MSHSETELSYTFSECWLANKMRELNLRGRNWVTGFTSAEWADKSEVISSNLSSSIHHVTVTQSLNLTDPVLSSGSWSCISSFIGLVLDQTTEKGASYRPHQKGLPQGDKFPPLCLHPFTWPHPSDKPWIKFALAVFVRKKKKTLLNIPAPYIL